MFLGKYRDYNYCMNMMMNKSLAVSRKADNNTVLPSSYYILHGQSLWSQVNQWFIIMIYNIIIIATRSFVRNLTLAII